MAEDTTDDILLPASGGDTWKSATKYTGGRHHALPILSKIDGSDAITPLLAALAAIEAAAEATQTATEALAAITAAFGAKATADAPEPNEGDENLPLSTNLWQALRVALTDATTGLPIDTSLASPVFFDVPGPKAPRLPMATNTDPQVLLAAGGSGVFYDLVGWKAYNPAGGSTVIVQIIDDEDGANVVVDEMVLAAGAQDSSGCPNVPTEQLAANKAWSVKLSGAVAGVIVKAWFTTRTAP